MSPKLTHQYATLSSPGSKKFSVCSRRIGRRERMTIVASCNDESTAEHIVDALNALQGKVDMIDTPAQRLLRETRENLIALREAMASLQRAKIELDSKFSRTEKDCLRAQNELGTVRRDLVRKSEECDALRKKENA